MFKLVFEGIDGSGKSTQIEKLSKKLEILNFKYQISSDISLRPIRQIYKKMIKNKDRFPSNELSLLINFADYKYIEEYVIKSEVDYFIYDRYIFSTLADLYALEMNLDIFSRLVEIFPLPDRIYFIDIKPIDALSRKNSISYAEAGGDLYYERNKGDLNKAYIDFQNKIYEGYEKYFILNKINKRVLRIDGTLDPEEISDIIFEDIKKNFYSK